jgi:FkbM family methyltransferase
MAEPAVQDDLVYDVGMHRGEDTAFYLAKGFRVVAFEANPELVGLSQRRFGAEIGTGRLHIVSGAIVAPGSDGRAVRFYKHPERSEWGTMDQAWGRSHGLPIGEFGMVEVEPIDFARCIREYGMPYYMKIDVEGVDGVCVGTLSSFATRPSYVSLESERHHFEVLERELDLLESLGYDRFKPVQQAWMDRKEILTQDRRGAPLRFRFEPHSSGPFGKDLSGDWLTKPQILARYGRIFWAYRFWANQPLLVHTRVGRQVRRLASTFLNRPLPGWYDTHAKHSQAR